MIESPDMKTFLKTKAWPVVAGLLVAFIIMMVFEYVNSLIYPLPEGLDITDPSAVKAFTATLPWTAYILVLLGWIIGAFKAGYITTRLARESAFRLSLVVGIILTVLGAINNALIGHDMVFNIIGLPCFIVFAYLGHWYMRRKNSSREQNANNLG